MFTTGGLALPLGAVDGGVLGGTSVVPLLGGAVGGVKLPGDSTPLGGVGTVTGVGVEIG